MLRISKPEHLAMTAFLKDKPAPTAEQLAAIAKLEEKAEDSRRRAEESFQRCDTDGFLSQWALNIGADLDREKANLLRDGGHAQFPVLCDEAGNVLAHKVYKFADRFAPDQWNAPTVKKWRLPDDEIAKRGGRKWIPVAGIRASRVQKALGLHEEHRWFPAIAKITTGGRKSTGLGGCANAFVAVFKQGEEE
jgi:hypothetical protein